MVVGVAVGAGLTSAVYTGARSVYRLFDRKKHNQSIGLKDSEARNAWLNVGVGVVSVGAAGATQVVASAARNGRNISSLARNSVRVVNIAAVTVNAGACVDESCSFIYILCKDGIFSKDHAAQLLFDLFLLRHSVNNFHQFRQIIANTDELTPLLCESQKESFQNLIGQTKQMCGDAVVAVGKPIVRSLKISLTDPRIGMDIIQMVLKNAQNANETIEDGFKAVWGTIATPIAREYCREFDNYIKRMINELERKMNIGVGKLNTILRPLINILRDITFKACNKILNFLQEFVIEMAQLLPIHFERYLKMYHIELKQRSAIEHTDLNDFILSKRDDELRETFSGETENLEKLEQIDTIYDEAYGSECDLEETRKLELLIDEYASEYTEEFIKYSPATNTNELHEIIVQILQKLPHEEATILFTVAKQLITKHAKEIQESLGRFLSVDIFIVDIYCLLTDLSCKNDFESLSEYLTKFVNIFDELAYTTIEDEFKQIYDIKNVTTLKKICCSTCKGDVFVNKK